VKAPVNKQERQRLARDTGMAMTLLLLLVMLFTRSLQLVVPAIAVLVLTMTWPMAFAPLSRVWFGLSNLLGAVVSRVLLTVIFFLIATPIGLLRRLAGKDSMKRKAWRQGSSSVFTERNHTYAAEDLERPY